MFNEPLKSSFAAAVAAAVCALIASSFALSVVLWALALNAKIAAVISAPKIGRQVLLIDLLQSVSTIIHGEKQKTPFGITAGCYFKIQPQSVPSGAFSLEIQM